MQFIDCDVSMLEQMTKEICRVARRPLFLRAIQRFMMTSHESTRRRPISKLVIWVGEYPHSPLVSLCKHPKKFHVYAAAEEDQRLFLTHAMHCFFCNMPPETLSWIYIVIPECACRDRGAGKG